MSVIKAIQFHSPAWHSHSEIKSQANQFQLYCQAGGLFRVNIDDFSSAVSLSDIANECIGKFDAPYPVTFFACGEHAENTIDLLYRDLLPMEDSISDQAAAFQSELPELLNLPSPNGISSLAFKIRGSKEIHCKMYFDEYSPIDDIVIYANDFGDSTDSGGAEQFFHALYVKKKNTAVITFDWPRHGHDDSESILPEDCSNYLSNLTTYIRKNIDPSTMSVYAVGFGAYFVMRYIRDYNNPFYRIVLRSPMINIYSDLIKNCIMDKDKRLALLKGTNVQIGIQRPIEISKAEIKTYLTEDITLDSFSEYCDDLLIIHGIDDQYVSVDSVEHFAAINDFRIKLVERTDHFFIDPAKMETVYREALAFLWKPIDPIPPDNKIIRKYYDFHGKVHSVGFCWRALAYATDVDAAGCVKENDDGTVTMAIESTKARIDLVIKRLKRVSSIRIEHFTSSTPAHKDAVNKEFSWHDHAFHVGKEKKSRGIPMK